MNEKTWKIISYLELDPKFEEFLEEICDEL